MFALFLVTTPSNYLIVIPDLHGHTWESYGSILVVESIAVGHVREEVVLAAGQAARPSSWF
jgi:hypothetical protein